MGLCSYRRILSHFNLDIKNPDPHFVPPFIPHSIPIIGFSATFSRHDGLALGSVFEKIVYHRDFLDMIKEQWQAFLTLRVEANHKLTTGYVMCDSPLSKLVSIYKVSLSTRRQETSMPLVWLTSSTPTPSTPSLCRHGWTAHVRILTARTDTIRIPFTASDRKSTLVFCVNLAHVRQLTKAFREFGIDARQLHSKTPAIERRTLIAEFKAGRYPVLVNCGVLHELPFRESGGIIYNLDSNLNRRRGHSERRLHCYLPSHTVSKCVCTNGSPQNIFHFTYVLIPYYRLAEACDSPQQVEKLIVVSLTLWTRPLVFLALSRYRPYLA